MPHEDPRAGALEGRTWHLTRGVDLPSGTLISARFAGGTVTGSAGEDRYRAEYRLDGRNLRIGPPTSALATGDVATSGDAPAIEAGSDFMTLLEAVARYRTDPVAATLSLLDVTGDVVLVFSAAPEIGANLAGRWDVGSSRVGDGLAPPTVDPPPYIVFDGSGQVTGSTGVNRLDGPARADADRLHLGPLVSTRMAGAPGAMDAETALMAALEKVAAYRIDREELVLLDADDEPLVRLTRSAEASS